MPKIISLRQFNSISIANICSSCSIYLKIYSAHWNNWEDWPSNNQSNSQLICENVLYKLIHEGENIFCKELANVEVKSRFNSKLCIICFNPLCFRMWINKNVTFEIIFLNFRKYVGIFLQTLNRFQIEY